MLPLSAQQATTAAELQLAGQQRADLRQYSPLLDLPTRNIGPNVQGGRIVDLAVDPGNDRVWYAAYASGGLFRTTNAGQSWEPLFDNQLTLGIGDIALAPSQPSTIWLGSGENNSSRSSYAGAGVFRSTDSGATWQDCGLTNTQHIGRIVVHPKDPNTAWVAAIGPLYTTSPDRGVYKTTDGGKNWKKTLFVNDRTGAIDLVINPKYPDMLLAATWDRLRRAWDFDGDGEGSGIYMSIDGGETWSLSVNGFPQGKKVGRIGLDISLSDPNTVYAVLDNQESDPSLQREDTIAGIWSRRLLEMSGEDFAQLENEKLDSFLRGKGYPEKYTAEGIKADVEARKYSPKDVGDYFGDANKALFNSAVKGAEVYRSNDGGRSWKKAHEDPLTGVAYTYGYYFGQVRVAPDNADHLYIHGVPMLQSTDGGANWSRVDTFQVHVDHHALWINPQDAQHILLGNDGGVYQSYDGGTHWTHYNNVAAGQFYTVHVDMAKPHYNVYGGLQDNGTLKGPSNFIPNRGRNWERLFGGDGMFVQTDAQDPSLVYVGFQYGNYYRMENGRPNYITPTHDIGQPKYRWNWRTPLRQSPHNHEIFYMGSQFLHMSLDQGDNWTDISPDLTTDHENGNVPYSTISTISESPFKFGLVWVGTDDGRIHVTTDLGNTWKRVDESLPQGLWVSKVLASPHDQNTAFVSLTGYREDDFHTYVYRTTDLGETWTSLKGNLPEEAVNVIIQDPVQPELLYLGSDHGTYASMDGGQNWKLLASLPNVASYDMVVHPRENELVVATHGRSMYVLDVKPLQAWMDREEGQSLMAWEPKKVRWSKGWGEKPNSYSDARVPKIGVRYFLNDTDAPGRTVQIQVKDADGKVVFKDEAKGNPGMNVWNWDLDRDQGDGYDFLRAGEYTIDLQLNFEHREVPLVIEKK